MALNNFLHERMSRSELSCLLRRTDASRSD